MTQLEARAELAKILQVDELDGYENCTGAAETCPIDECMLCGVRDCPGNEPLHYHHDGCPYCYVDPRST
jgi:hypothetical protein